MMGKRAAQELARAETLSFGDLKAMIEAARGRVRFSTVNPAIELDRACNIYEAAIKDRPDDEKPIAWRTDPYSRSLKPSRDFLIVTNILRDCGSPSSPGKDTTR